MRMNFALVKFTSEDDSVAIISTTWISKDRQSCQYPKGPNLERFLKKRTVPNHDWEVYPIHILKEYETFDDARSHLPKAQETSYLDSEPDDLNKRKRVFPVRFGEKDKNELSDKNLKKKFFTIPIIK